MEQFITQIQTKSKIETQDDITIAEPQQRRAETQEFSINSPEDVLEALRSKPDLKLVSRILQWLTSCKDQSSDIQIRQLGPKAVQIIYALVNNTIPEYWHILSGNGASEYTKQRRRVIMCLRSVAGIGAIISRVRDLLSRLKGSQISATLPAADKSQALDELLNILEGILDGNECINLIWRAIHACDEQISPKSLQWKDLLSLVASGKLLAITAEASSVSNDGGRELKDGSWIGNGNLYTTWLGRNIQYMNNNVRQDDVEGRRSTSQLLSKALSLGYRNQIIKATFQDLISGNGDSIENYQALVGMLVAHEQKSLLHTLIDVLSKEKLWSESSSAEAKIRGEAKTLGGVAAVIATLVENTPSLQANLVEWLVSTSANAAVQTHLAHRAIIVVVASNNEQAFKTLQSCLEEFGNKRCMKHIPILHQEVTTQILLMFAGYCFRLNKTDLADLSRSSIYLNAISNRLAASSQRARFLGMVVGTAISELVDPKDRRMNFGAEDLNSPEGLWYRSLPTIKDTIGSIKDLKPMVPPPSKPTAQANKSANGNSKLTKLSAPTTPTSRVMSIEEINDSSDTEDDDLPIYAKPDSDISDSDEDATLVQRDRPTAPVYIRDLIGGLRDTENFDRHKLALTNAASLIRRKASFGTEISDNIEELATLLVGLNDKWEMDDFQKLRLQGMIAVLTAEPLKMGQWFSKTFYNGEYSMGQRACILTTLGMGARELAGLGKEDAALTGAQAKENTFPSKRLPDKLHKIYALEAAPMDALSSQLEKAMIQPMAATAADQITGPNALKVRTFSSRMAVEKKRQRPIPNALAKVVAEGFFFPLTGRWRIHLQSYGESSSHTSPFLLSHLLKTLSLILHASGSSTLSLPQMTSEFWDLLLSLRPRATDPAVLEALLFAFLTLLDINENDQRRVAEEHAKELLETQKWVGTVFERIGGGSEEGDRIRMLAAGVLMRTREVVEKYQRMLMGDMIGYM